MTRKLKVAVLLSLVLAGILFASIAAEAFNLSSDMELGIEYNYNLNQTNIFNNFNIEISDWVNSDIYLLADFEITSDLDEIDFNRGEAYLDYYGQNTDYRIGWQTISWGAVDGNSPVDTMNPRDLSDPFADDNKIPVPAIAVEHYFDNTKLDFIYQPVAEGDKLPGLTPELPDRDLKNPALGLRYSYSSRDFDLAGIYSRTLNYNPEVSATEYYFENSIGGELVYQFDRSITRLDLAYNIPEDDYQDIIDNELNYVATYEINITSALLFLGGIQGSQSDEDILIFNLDYMYDFYQNISFGAAYSLEESDYLINLEYTNDIADGMELKAGLYYFGDDNQGAYGQFQDDDHIYLSITRSF